MQNNNNPIVPRSISPDGGANIQEFDQEILSKINSEHVGNDGEVFNPQLVALRAFGDGKARLAASGNIPKTEDGSSGSVVIEAPMPGYQEIDSRVDSDEIQISKQPNTDQANPERSPELVS